MLRILFATAVIGTIVYLSPARREADRSRDLALRPAVSQGAARSRDDPGSSSLGASDARQLVEMWDDLPQDARRALARRAAQWVAESGQPSPEPPRAMEALADEAQRLSGNSPVRPR